MAIIKSKGTVLSMSISGTYTAISNLTSVDISDEKTITFGTEVINQTDPYKTKMSSGYTDPPTIKAEGFFDPSNASWQAYEGLLTSHTETNFKVTYTDSAPTSKVYKGVGFGLDKKMAMTDGVKANITIETSGAPT